MSGMQYKTIQEICDIQTGSKDVNEGSFDGKYHFFTCAAEPLRSDAYSFSGESIILPGNGANVGLALYFNGDFEAYQRTYILNNFKDAYPRYVYYYFLCNWKRHNSISQYGSATNYIRMENITSFKIPICPLTIQIQIVKTLDKADELRQKRKQQIELLDKYLESVFYEMFGDPVKNEKEWNVKPLYDLVSIDRKIIDPKDILDETIYIDLESIEKETGVILKKQYVMKGDIKSAKYRFTPSHILYGKLRPYLNKVVRPSFSGVCSTDIFPILPNQCLVDKSFIWFIMKSHTFVNYANSRTNGANLPRVSASAILAYECIQPDLNQQRKFAKLIEQVDKTKEKMQESLVEMDNLFNSLMQKAFKE